MVATQNKELQFSFEVQRVRASLYLDNVTLRRAASFLHKEELVDRSLARLSLSAIFT